MKTITIHVNEDLLARAQEITAKRKLSINSILLRSLEKFVQRYGGKSQILQQMDDFYKQSVDRKVF